jgi:hypothetical protein
MGQRHRPGRPSAEGIRDLFRYGSGSDTSFESSGTTKFSQSASSTIRGKSLYEIPSKPLLTVHQAINATEIGDIEAAWRFTSAASTICYALDLHKKNNPFTGDRSHEAIEAFSCFGFTYMQDKGLAMNLGRPACLQDLYIEEEVFERSIQEEKRPTLFYQYINLARVQSRVITDLHSAGRSAFLDINGVVTDILNKMDRLWESMQEVTVFHSQGRERIVS